MKNTVAARKTNCDRQKKKNLTLILTDIGLKREKKKEKIRREKLRKIRNREGRDLERYRKRIKELDRE